MTNNIKKIFDKLTRNRCHIGKLNELQRLRKRTSKIAGVYCIFNRVTGMFYIGSSLNLFVRISDYTQKVYLRTYRHLPLIRAINDLGVHMFMVIILEITEKDLSILLAAENKAFRLFNPPYNTRLIRGSAKGDGNPFFGKIHTQETKRMITLSNKNRMSITIHNTNTGEINTYNSIRACQTQTIYTRYLITKRLNSGQPIRPGIFVYKR
jgi:hypothetical protein